MWIWLVLTAVFCAFLWTEYYAFRTGVPTVASFAPVRARIAETLNDRLGEGRDGFPAVVVDLGSGNGQLARKIARSIPRARVVGVEISYVPWLLSVIRQKLLGPSNLEFRRTDFWSYDCAQADAVVTYLTENVIERLSRKLREELRPGALVVANDTALRGDWAPVEEIDAGLFGMKLYVYRQ